MKKETSYKEMTRNTHIIKIHQTRCMAALLIMMFVALLFSCKKKEKDPTDDENTCNYGPGIERIGVRRSTDNGLTWQFLGHACFNSSTIIPADPSPVAIDGGGVALFIFDIASGSTLPTIYRATTTDGIHFTTPEPAITYPEGITDPYILQMHNGCRMYFCADSGNMSAWSDNCITFATEPGIRTTQGGAPGALLLSDGRVRLFGSGDWGSEHGILSFISTDGGLTFTQEPGLRISLVNGLSPGAQHPISLHQGGYIMAFHVVPPGQDPIGV
jgi:hypothetical protein